MKVSEKQMLKLKEIDEKIDELYEMKSRIVEKILSAKGDSTGIMYVEGLEKPWMRITLTDNFQPFMEREVIYRVASFRRYDSKIEYLKHEPKKD